MAGELVVDWHKLSLTRDEDNVAMEVGKEMMVCLVGRLLTPRVIFWDVIFKALSMVWKVEQRLGVDNIACRFGSHWTSPSH
ncbi:unnamed protein product [Citrullus colocynthis]|uniref:Uncharacterized protein n=1 Tax=Citrullus colocynthis TaxID=252529 RepID=A0ABP0Z472_9ROSI